MLSAGCGDDTIPIYDVSGAWSYDWQVRETGAPYPGWDGHFHGELVLAQDGADVTGALGYPVEDPATLFGDAGLRDAWRWQVYGVLVDAELHLFAPAPGTAWDDGHLFRLVVGADAMAGTDFAGAELAPRWTFVARRSSLQ
jgi:hypothetical protein